MNIVFLLAAGTGRRFGENKLFALINGKPVIWHSLKLLENSSHVSEIYIAVNKNNAVKIKKLSAGFQKVKFIIFGGKTRYESVVKLAEKAKKSSKNPKFFIIHNAANPFASEQEITACLSKCKNGIFGVAVGRKINSTIKKTAKGSNVIEKTISRQNLWEMETPQIVLASSFIKACAKFSPNDYDFTDDLSVLEAAGLKTVVANASSKNRKITNTDDLPKEFLVGIGEDSHKFMSVNKKNARKNLVLAGVKIKSLPALDASSDGDVVLHALCNAIASAVGESSLGSYATQMCEKGIKNSRKYLDKIVKAAGRKFFFVNQCALSIEAARPLIDPLSMSIKKNLSAYLRIPKEKIGITATSGKGLTPFGKGEAIHCTVIVLLTNCDKLQIPNYKQYQNSNIQ